MAKYLDATGVSTLWGKIKSSFASSGHNHDGRYLQYNGWWSSGNGNNADDATGMVFAYSSHNVPSGWGILTTFEYQRSSGYKMQLFSNGYTDGETYYRNRSSDRGGWGNWVRFLDSTNYTSYTVTKTGSGASGTWGINISGNAATATSATSATSASRLSSITLPNGADMNNYTTTGVYGNTGTNNCASFVNGPAGRTNGEMRLEVIGCNNNGTYLFQKYWARGGTTDWQLFIRSKHGSGWTSWSRVAMASEIPSTLSWSSITSKPDTATRWPSWSEVTDKPSTFTPSSHTHSYLPLSGGELTSSNFYPLTINGGSEGSGLQLKGPDSKLGIVLFKPGDWGMAMLNFSASKAIGIKDDGAPYYGWGGSKYTLLHTGNSAVSKSGETLTVNMAGTTYSLTNTWRGITDSYSGSDTSISLSQKGANNMYNSLLNGYATSAGSAGSATSASYLPPKYDGGDKPNPQSYFNENIGAKVAMTRYATIGGTTSWFDTLWINGYAGSDVPNMVALTTIRNGTPRAFLSAQSSRSTTYGAYYELISSYNIASQSVNYATSSGTANSPRGFSFSDRSSNDWTGVPGTFITDWSHSSGADIMFKNDGAKLNVITDGRFYQGIDVYGSSKRVLDEYDITHTTWGNADTLDGYHYNTLYTSVGDWISKVGNTYTITVNGDSDTYYPVVIDATFDKTSRNFISIWKNLGSPTANYQYNHSNGTSSMWLIIEGRSCTWDGNGGYYRTIYRSQPYANLISEATTVYSSVSVLCVYLRGGGTEYKISTTYPTTVRVYLEETNLGSTTYPAIVNPRTSVANGGIINGTFYGNCTGNAASASSVPNLSNSEIDTIMV